jgi:DNA-binding beta-propeller fold protein YncE
MRNSQFRNSHILFVIPLLVFVFASAIPASADYHLLKKVVLGGEGFWDYLTVDVPNRHIFISHGTHVMVLDADTYAVVGDIPGTDGVHGIAVADDLGRGFTSNGRSNSVTIFDLKSFKVLGTVPTGQNPDAIVYDSASHRVFTMNGRSGDSTAIEGATGKVAGTIPLGGKPEFATADGAGNVYVNIEDKSVLVNFDSNDLKVKNTWPLAPCQEPSGMAIDVAHHRLFSGCHNKMMAIVDARTGRCGRQSIRCRNPTRFQFQWSRRHTDGGSRRLAG